MPESEIDIIPKGLHHTEHEIGGIDEVDVTDLSGQLADAQPALAHQASHITGADLLGLDVQSFENLLINGDFEIGNPPVNWTLGGAGATFARSNAQFRIGAYSGLLTRNGNDCYAGQAIPSYLRYAGRTVTFGCWVWASVAGRADLQLTDGVTNTQSATHSGSSAWEWITITKTLDATPALFHARVRVTTGDTAAYFDGAILVEGSLCPAFSPKPAELIVQETEVYNAAAPVAWTDLNLSATVGAQSCLVLLKVTETSNTAATLIAARKNGDTDEFMAGGGSNNIAFSLAGQNSSFHVVLAVFTDGAGIIEIRANAANTLTIDVMGYVKC